MPIRPLKGNLKWFVLSTLLTLVTLVTLLQTLNISTSITAYKRHSNEINPYMGIISNSTFQTQDIISSVTSRTNAKNELQKKTPGDAFTYNHSEFISTKTVKLNEKNTHIGFLKVHKAGSTTMQNIFFRFGLKYNLTFVLPTKGHYFLSSKTPMPVKPGNHNDILACHSVYSRKLFGSVLPKDSVNIGIVRKPLDRMISAAYYYRDVWKSPPLVKVPRANFIHNLINRPDLYETGPFTKTKNAMGQDFGFPSSVKINDTNIINTHLDLLKADFKQVLVMERFDESLILMKRTLNWELSDILYLKTNSHAHQPVLLSLDELEKFKSTCFLDYIIYDTFYEIFDRKVTHEGSGFMEEVEHFQSVLELVKQFCEDVMKSRAMTSLKLAKSVWNNSFEVTVQDCFFMNMKELKFVDFLKKRHISMNG